MGLWLPESPEAPAAWVYLAETYGSLPLADLPGTGHRTG